MFLQEMIINDDNEIMLNQEQEKSPAADKDRDHGFRVIIQTYREDLNDILFTSQREIREFINTQVLIKERTMHFIKFVKFLSKAGRQLIRSIKLDQNRDFKLDIFSAEIDEGLWDTPKYNVMSFMKPSDDISNLKIGNAELRFSVIEGNYMHVANFETIKNMFPKKLE